MNRGGTKNYLPPPSSSASSSPAFRRNRRSRDFYQRGQRPNQGQPSRTPTDRSLLITRSNFKGQSFSLLNIQTQASYLTGCLHLGLTSPGLQIKVRCLAARPDLTNVHQRFQEHIHQSERGAMNILIDHFNKAATLLKDQLRETLHEMKTLMDSATPSELICHQRYLSATEKNINLEAEWRQREANKKLSLLHSRRKRQDDRYQDVFEVCRADTYGLQDIDRLRIYNSNTSIQPVSATLPPTPATPTSVWRHGQQQSTSATTSARSAPSAPSATSGKCQPHGKD